MFHLNCQLQERLVRLRTKGVLRLKLLGKFLPNAYLLVGLFVLVHGLHLLTFAQSGPGSGVFAGDDRIYEAARRLFLLIEGNFGALIMVCAGLASIIAAAFNQYRKAFSMLIVASGAFILRSLVVIFFDFK